MTQETLEKSVLTRGSFTEGSLVIHVRRLSGYMILGFLAMTVAQLIEAVYLGVFGKEELAAVAFTFPVVMALSAMTRGLGIGAGAAMGGLGALFAGGGYLLKQLSEFDGEAVKENIMT